MPTDTQVHSSLVRLALNIQEVAERADQQWHKELRPIMTLNIQNAALTVCGHSGMHTRESELVCLLLQACWNDALDWANATIDNANK